MDRKEARVSIAPTVLSFRLLPLAIDFLGSRLLTLSVLIRNAAKTWRWTPCGSAFCHNCSL